MSLLDIIKDQKFTDDQTVEYIKANKYDTNNLGTDPDIDKNIMLYCIQKGYNKSSCLLLKQFGLKPFGDQNKLSCDPICLALGHNMFKFVNMLIETDIYINVYTKNNNMYETAFCLACYNKELNIIDALLDFYQELVWHDCNFPPILYMLHSLNRINKNDIPLYTQIIKKWMKIFKDKAGLDIPYVEYNKKSACDLTCTALLYTTYYNMTDASISIIRWLDLYGKKDSINALDGWTSASAFCYAVRYKNELLIKELIKRNIKVGINFSLANYFSSDIKEILLNNENISILGYLNTVLLRLKTKKRKIPFETLLDIMQNTEPSVSVCKTFFSFNTYNLQNITKLYQLYKINFNWKQAINQYFDTSLVDKLMKKN